jgi:hypothetical protein
MAGIRAQLSPKEEATLRRIVLGVSDDQELHVEDAMRLNALGLIRTVDGKSFVTEAGMNRYRDLSQQTAPKPPPRRRLKSRSLPF